MSKPTTRSLMDAANISKTYAWGILNGEHTPSRPLANFIYRETGWRHPIIADLTDEQLETLWAVEPWARAA